MLFTPEHTQQLRPFFEQDQGTALHRMMRQA